MRRHILTAFGLALAACAPAADSAQGEKAQPPAAVEPPPAPGPDPATIMGTWRIESLNDVPLRSVREDGEESRTPRLGFSPSGYGGTSGCNFFGGLGLLEGHRYYTAPGGQTAMGCGDLTAQEDAITGIMWGAPVVALEDGGILRLTAGNRKMVLRRAPELDSKSAVIVADEPPLLAGTQWTVLAMDGQWLQAPSAEARGKLSFEADGWSGRAACSTLGGGWRQQDDRIHMTDKQTTTEQLCPPDQAAIDGKLSALMRARPRFTVGPNGEILIAGGGHWLVGERTPRQPSDDASILNGGWHIASIDRRPPIGGIRPTITFGVDGYRGDTGCNGVQGMFVAQGRRLFTAAGATTERACGPLTGQEKRIADLLAESPRIALAGEAVVLIGRSGRLELRRDPTAARPVPSATKFRGRPLSALLVTLDGRNLHERFGQPEIRLRLTADRWDIDLGCGQLGGVWRQRGKFKHFYTDAEPAPSGCDAARVSTLMRMMNGTGQIIFSESGELLVAGEEHWLTGRLDPSGPRK